MSYNIETFMAKHDWQALTTLTARAPFVSKRVRLTGLAIWFLYFLGQWGIAAAFLRR